MFWCEPALGQVEKLIFMTLAINYYCTLSQISRTNTLSQKSFYMHTYINIIYIDIQHPIFHHFNIFSWADRFASIYNNNNINITVRWNSSHTTFVRNVPACRALYKECMCARKREREINTSRFDQMENGLPWLFHFFKIDYCFHMINSIDSKSSMRILCMYVIFVYVFNLILLNINNI